MEEITGLERNDAFQKLRRCTICKKFHASYLVEDTEFVKCYLCYSCWKSGQEKVVTLKKEGMPDTKEKVTLKA